MLVLHRFLKVGLSFLIIPLKFHILSTCIVVIHTDKYSYIHCIILVKSLNLFPSFMYYFVYEKFQLDRGLHHLV